ncbi:hypothetical protein BSKO_10771 [Bryopsis sp. KO-2023]|nr:hypothetical protein BSKO_10771 [Bryopsis sp. KO-2023]
MPRPRVPPSVKKQQAAAAAGKVKLGDTAGMKHALDTAATAAVLNQGYKEDKFVPYTKLALGLLAIILALTGQFYPGKLKDNWWLVLSCVLGYAASSGGLTLFCTLKEGNAILFTLPRRGGIGIKVSSTLPRFSEFYTLQVEAVDKKEHFVRKPVELKKSVAEYFHSDGELATSVFQADVKKLLRSFEEKD